MRRFFLSAHHRQLDVQQLCQLFDLAQLVTHAQGKVVRGAGLGPGLAELVGRHIPEAHAGVRVADLKYRPWDGFALRGDELEAPIACLGQPKQRDRPVLDVELHRHAPASLAVEEFHAAQDRLLIADADVSRSVVPGDDETALEVQQVQLAERAPGIEVLQDEHGHARLQVRLTRAGDASGCQH